MKVCETCGDDIGGFRDGENDCIQCQDIAHERNKLAVQKRLARRRRKAESEAALSDCGLVKVRGSLGGTYWE